MAKLGDMEPRREAGVESVGGWKRGKGCHGHPCRVQTGNTWTGCWPHGRDAACRADLSLCMTVAGSGLWGGCDGTGKGAMGQAGDYAADTLPRVSRC